MNNTRLFKVVLFLLFILILVFVYTYYKNYLFTENNNENKPVVNDEKFKFNNEVGPAKAQVTGEVVETSVPRTEAEIADVDDWFKKNGIGPSRNSYENYSNEELAAMVFAGDFIAGDVLTERYIAETNLVEAELTAETSLVYGSHRSIMNLYLIHHYDLPSVMDDDSTRLQKKNQLISMLSYLELADLRGARDLFGTDSYRRVALMSFNRAYEKDVVLTEEDYLTIQHKAKLLYEDYQNRRYELGLGDFDDELPKEVADYLR
jgi:hypothetical protein